MEDERIIILKSYSKVWKIERLLYSIGGVNFPYPIALNTLIYFAIFAAIMTVISKAATFGLSPFYRYLVIPGVLAWLFNNKLLDGKNPITFLRSIIIHYFVIFFKGSHVNRFKHFKPSKKRAFYSSKVSYRKLTKI